MGSLWEGFGVVLGLLWVLLAVAWPFFGHSKLSFFQALAQNGLQEGFWRDLGSIWGRIWEDLERIWEGVEGIFLHFWMHAKRI